MLADLTTPFSGAAESPTYVPADRRSDERERYARFVARCEGNCVRARKKRALPASVRAQMQGGAAFALVRRLAGHRVPAVVATASEVQAQAFARLNIAPRDPTLYEWCGLAVDMAKSPVLARLLESTDARTIAGILEEVKLLEIVLNVTQDDVSDVLGDVAALERVARATYPRAVCDRIFHAELACSLDVQSTAREQQGIELLATLNRAVGEEVERRVETLVGREIFARYRAEWDAAHARVVGSMLFSAVQNTSPARLRGMSARELLDAFASDDPLAIEACNGNRVTFELVDLMLVERLSGRAFGPEARRSLLSGFRALEVSQQLSNCVSTLRREIREGDRANAIIAHAASCVAAQMRPDELREALARHGIDAVANTSAEIVDELFVHLRRAARAGHTFGVTRMVAFVEEMVARTGAESFFLREWEAQVESACVHLRRGYALAGLDRLFDPDEVRSAAAQLMAHHCVFLDTAPDDAVRM